MGVNHVRLVMNQNCEVFVYGSPRGRPSGSSETCTKLKYGKEMQKQLKKIKKKMHLKSNTEILLALSVATDEMIRHVSMFPETWYFDVTENTNSEKRGLFLGVVQDSNTQTFIGNATIIPCGQRWVFQKIYQRFFLYLLGEINVSRIRLGLTDDDHAEYGPLDNAIATNPSFKKCRHMLCVFHGIVMMFQKSVHKKLPQKKKPGKGCSPLTKNGEFFGTYLLVFISSVYLHLVLANNEIFFSSFLRKSSV